MTTRDDLRSLVSKITFSATCGRGGGDNTSEEENEKVQAGNLKSSSDDEVMEQLENRRDSKQTQGSTKDISSKISAGFAGLKWSPPA